MNNAEKNIVTKAINQFQQETGLMINAVIADNNAEIILVYNDYELKFDALVITFIQKEKLGIIKNRLAQLKNIPLVITALVGAEVAALLRDLNINFIDTAGNTFINVPPLLLNIKGNRPIVRRKITAKTKARTAADGKLTKAEPVIFPVGALKIIFTLLCNPGLEINPYREIAQIAGVALGTVHFAMKQLEKMGYLIDRDGTKKLINKEILLRQWVDNYPGRLKHKYQYGRFQLDNTTLIDTINLKYYNALLGGETAAARVTNYLRPLIHTLYMNERFGELVLKNRLKKNPNGNLLIFKKFWNFEDDNTAKGLVPDLLIYADLITTADDRNIETANLIFEREIVRLIK